MRIYFDTEFIEDGKTIELLSIGMVREDGEFYYAEPIEADVSKASDWVKTNVLPNLNGKLLPRTKIAADIVVFSGEAPEFWAYFCSYDWIALCQLFGPMIDLPKHWPMYCNDVKQLCHQIGNPKLPEQESAEHNALNDAVWTMEAHHFLLGRMAR